MTTRSRRTPRRPRLSRRANLPALELTEPILYELLLAEIALQRGQRRPRRADLRRSRASARRTRASRAARWRWPISRARRSIALEAARVWHEADPAVAAGAADARRSAGRRAQRGRRRALPREAAGRATARRGERLPAARAPARRQSRQGGQPARGAQPRRASIRTCRRRTSRVAQAALAANDEAAALAETRRAAKLQPDWEVAAIFEAQILQRRSPQEASAALAAFLAKYPKAREARLAYARVLCRRAQVRRGARRVRDAARRQPGQRRRHLRGGAARGAAQGLPDRREESQAAARPGLPRPERRALHARPDRRGAEALAGRDRVVPEHRARRPVPAVAHAHGRRAWPSRASSTRRARTCSRSMRRGRAARAAARRRGAAAARSEPAPRGLRPARQGARRRSPSSPSCSTTTRSPPRSSSASTCSKATCAS